MNGRQYTVRGIPPSVDRLLRRKAAERKVSLNALLLRALENEAGLGAEPSVHGDLDALIGSWLHDPEVDKALQEQRAIDPADWG